MNTFMCTSKCKDLCKKDPYINKKMNISEKGIDFIANYEGFSANKYYDIGGNATIGYGHLILEGENYSKPITKEKAKDLLKKDIKFAIAAVNTSVKVPITQTEFDALVSLAFNIGVGAFKSSTLLKKLNSGEPVTSRHLGMWNRVNGKISLGLSKRRIDEFELYKNGNYEITRRPRRGRQ